RGNLIVIAEAWSNLGYELYFKRLKKYFAALDCYKKAVGYAGPRELVNIYDNIAAVYAAQHNYDSAFYSFQRAFDQIKPGINEKDLLANTQQYVSSNFIEYIVNLVLDKADLYLDRFKEMNDRQSLEKAVEIYKTADQLFENIKQNQYDIESKLFWRQNLHRLYDRSIEACYLQNDAASAFYFFERSRAVLLSDQLSEHRWTGTADILQQSLLKKQILEEERNLSKVDEKSARYYELQSSIFSHKHQMDVLQDVIRAKIPFYYQNVLDSNFISIQDVRRDILKDHTALMELFSGDSALYVLTIDKTKTYFDKIEKNLFDSLSSRFSTYLSQPDLINRNYYSFTAVSHRLYQLIFRSAAVGPGRIIISPDKNYLPFEALVTSTRPFTYFLDDHAVSYTFSARYLRSQFSTSSFSGDHIFMGIAPLKFRGLPGLTGSDQSLKNVQENFVRSTSLIGNLATKNNFLNQFYKYKIVQLYTHATDKGQEGEPMIYFADSALSLSDLLPQEKPVSDLIVLSACETASGQVYSGEGVFSFNRSFAALGIPSTVSNLWQTNDQATYRLTEFFYKYVAEGMPLDIAMQKAKKDLLHGGESGEFQLPYYWASSILVGKTDAIIVQKSFGLKWIVFLLLAAILFIVGWKIRNK
ncbi:MAG: CHAT domain-containing protein, partial [Flavisolibacter sp.]